MPSRVTTTTPPDGIPQDSFKYYPLRQVRLLYIAFVQGLFAAAPPGCYHWCEGEESEIYVSDEHPIHAARAGQRPAVNFVRSAVQFTSLGMDDMLRYDFATGRKTKAVLIPGMMQINCCSRVDLESEHVAWIVAEHLWLLREQLLKQGFFEIGRNIQVSPPSPAGTIVAGDGGDGWYCTSVLSPFQFPRTSQFTPLGERILQNVALRVRAEFERVHALSFAPSSHEYPVRLEHEPQFASASPESSEDSSSSCTEAPMAPRLDFHPLNPAMRVVVQRVNPYGPALRAPMLNGGSVPIIRGGVKRS